MRSLIFLQAGSAMGGGFDSGFDRLASIGWTIGGMIGLGVVAGYCLKAVWPKDKW